MKKRLGIYGGTFDPIHIGHLIVSEAARYELGFEKVLFIPANSPPHKDDKYLSTPKERYKMVSLAIEDNPGFMISDIEIKREGPSYTVGTLKRLKQIHSKEYELWMIIGGDSLLAIDTWKDPEKIMDMCNLAVYLRPGSPADKCRAKAKTIESTKKTKIKFIEGPMIGISSTYIRDRIATGQSVRYMITDKVEDYIINTGLFRKQQRSF